MQRLSIREGWTTVVLTSLIVYIAVWSILQADWADGLAILNWVTLGGLAAGLVVSKWRRLPSAALHLGGLAFGFITILAAMTAYLPDEIGGRRDKLRWLWERGEQWFSQIANGESTEDLYLFVMFISAMVYLMAYIAIWFVFRARWIWPTLFFPGIVLLLNLGYSRKVPTGLVVVFLFVALLLLMRFTLMQRELSWRRFRVDYPDTIGWRGLWVASYLAIAVLIFGWAVPVDARSGRMHDLWTEVDGPWRTVEGQFDEWFVGLRGPGGRGIGGFASFDDSFDLGGPLSLTDSPVLILSGGDSTYLAAQRLNVYTGRGWETDVNESYPGPAPADATAEGIVAPQLELQPGESLPVGSNYTLERERESYTIQVEAPRGSRIFVPDSFASADVGANLVITWRQVDETLDVQGLEQADVPADLWPLVQLLQQADFTPIAPPTPTPDPNATATVPAEATPSPTPQLQLPPVPTEIRLEQQELVEQGINTSFALDSTNWNVSTLNYTGVFPVYDSVEAIYAREGLVEEDVYTVDALVSEAESGALRGAGVSYPDEITERYLGLPDTITPRTLELAQQLGTLGNNPYDIAKVIERHLRDTIVYNEQVAFPPANVDVVDHVLFDSQQGYCEYYASAFIVLARANGLPTRMVTGFAPSEESVEGGYLYREQQAHAWPEVYFPGYGWIAFEPTAARNIIERDPADAPPSAGGDGNVPEDRRGDAALGGGLDAGDIDFLEDNLDLPSGAGALGQSDSETSWTDLALRIAPLVLLLVVLVVVYLWLRGLRGLSPTAAMYTRVSRGASWSGIQRDPAMTANEYAQSIGDTVPGSRQPVRYLTDLYVSETYSPHKATQSDLLRGRQAWMRLRSLLLKNAVMRLRPWRKHDDERDTEEW